MTSEARYPWYTWPFRAVGLLWSLIQPSRLPKCPRCGRRLGALDDDHDRYCPSQSETKEQVR